MKFTIAAIAAAVLTVGANASALPRAALDVFVPAITSPTAATVWTANSVQTVTW